jgi:AraC family transcriptional regulator, regulatory protein of adaptative response / DNA-3-methyladenine glycosylase II
MLKQSGMSRDVLDRARRSRDARFDGKFFIAVTSTRIYCRSICPAKTSKDANVRYYATAAEAAAAGFRPCLRCRPEAAPGSPAWLGTSAVVRRALRLIQEGALDQGSVEELASRLGVGARHLGRLFTRHVGVAPVAVAQTRRLHFAKQLLDETDLPITEVALAAGFGSVRRFNDVFKRMYRRCPREMRKAGARRGLDAEINLRLTYRPPYDWGYVAGFLARRAVGGVECVESGCYCRTVRTPTGHVIIRIKPVAQADALDLSIQGGEASDLLSLSSAARRMFDLSADPARITSVLEADSLLRTLVARRPGLRIPGTWDLFESGLRAIAGQGITVEAGRSLVERLVQRVGERIAADGQGLTHLFPTPDSILATDLQSAGLPRVRAEALRAFARAVREGAIDSHGSTEHLLAALTELPGVGAWTAGYVLLRGLGEPDGFPSGDLIVKRQAGGTARTPLTSRELDERAEQWRPFRGYAVLHLWDAAAQEEKRRRRLPVTFEVRRQPVPAAPQD